MAARSSSVHRESSTESFEVDISLQSVVDSLAEGIIITDLEDRGLFASRRVSDMTGYGVSELVGNYPHRILTPEEQWHLAEKGTRRRARGLIDKYELQIRRKDSSFFWAEVSAAPFRDREGRIIGSIAAVTDIASRKEAESERTRYQQHFYQAQKMEAVGQLAAGVAHDLNNSLTAVTGHLQLMQSLDGLGPQVVESITVALTGCSRASALVSQLLAFSRQGEVAVERISLSEIVAQTIDFLRKVIGGNVFIEHEGAERGLYIMADQGHVQQVLTNLIINATQAMPQGGTIRFRYRRTWVLSPERFNAYSRSGMYAALEVCDTGSGIAPDILGRIFDPFFTTKEKGGGTGLGLAMVYGSMQQHRGWIEVESQVGIGTTFTLYFPWAADELSDDQAKAESLKKQPLVGSRRRILVIDDEPILADLAGQFFGRAGFEVASFTRGAEGLLWFQKYHAEVAAVILDMKMPEPSGVQCFDRLMSIHAGSHILLTSGFIDDQDIQHLMQRGALAFFPKPLKYQELVQWVVENIGAPQWETRL